MGVDWPPLGEFGSESPIDIESGSFTPPLDAGPAADVRSDDCPGEVDPEAASLKGRVESKGITRLEIPPFAIDNDDRSGADGPSATRTERAIAPIAPQTKYNDATNATRRVAWAKFIAGAPSRPAGT